MKVRCIDDSFRGALGVRLELGQEYEVLSGTFDDMFLQIVTYEGDGFREVTAIPPKYFGLSRMDELEQKVKAMEEKMELLTKKLNMSLGLHIRGSN